MVNDLRVPRATTQTPVTQTDPPRAQESAYPDPLDVMQPQTYVTEMEVLFSGTSRSARLRGEHPMEPLDIPGLETDILGPLPILGNRSSDLSDIIQRYQGLRANLIERRNNYTQVLEGYLRPEETLDIYDRIDQIDRALLKINQELDKAVFRREELRARERERAREALENQEI